MLLNTVKEIQLPKILDDRGNLSFLENPAHIPFEIERIYWIYDVPGGEIRGGHAYRTLYECIICLSGSFDLVLNDGYSKKKFFLNRSYNAILVPPMIWKHMENFSTNSLALVLANQVYDADDYIRNFDEYKRIQVES